MSTHMAFASGYILVVSLSLLATWEFSDYQIVFPVTAWHVATSGTMWLLHREMGLCIRDRTDTVRY